MEITKNFKKSVWGKLCMAMVVVMLGSMIISEMNVSAAEISASNAITMAKTKVTTTAVTKIIKTTQTAPYYGSAENTKKAMGYVAAGAFFNATGVTSNGLYQVYVAGGYFYIPVNSCTEVVVTPAPKQTLKETKTEDTAKYGKLYYASNDSFDSDVLECSDFVLVDFFATWCGPCMSLAPIIEEIAEEHPEIKVVEVDVDESYKIANRYRITSIPTLMFFKNGELQYTTVGYKQKSTLLNLIEQYK